MTLDQLRAFASNTEQHITKLALTKEAARTLIREHDREINAASDDSSLFELKDTDTPAYAALRRAGVDRMLERAGL